MEATGTDHLDLYFWHAMDDRREKVDYCKSKEFGDAVEVIKKSGKAKFGASQPTMPGATSTCRPPPRAGSLTSSWSSTARSSNNTDQVCDNLDAARRCEPLKVAELEQLRAATLAAASTMCVDCGGRCAEAAGTGTRLGDLGRYLTYHEHHSYRSEALRHYRELTDRERDWSGADLTAARAACSSQLDFARLLP